MSLDADLNCGPAVYKTAALPLSYPGKLPSPPHLTLRLKTSLFARRLKERYLEDKESVSS